MQRRSCFARPADMGVTLLISWNGFSETILGVLTEMGVNKSVGARHITFVRFRIAIVLVQVKCRFGLSSIARVTNDNRGMLGVGRNPV